MKEEVYFPQQAALYVDVYCWQCKKLAAMSNTVEIEGRRYCYRCCERNEVKTKEEYKIRKCSCGREFRSSSDIEDEEDQPIVQCDECWIDSIFERKGKIMSNKLFIRPG